MAAYCVDRRPIHFNIYTAHNKNNSIEASDMTNDVRDINFMCVNLFLVTGVKNSCYGK